MKNYELWVKYEFCASLQGGKDAPSVLCVPNERWASEEDIP